MTRKLEDFARHYREGFDAYLRDADERALSSAYELGRSAIAHELSILDLAATHHDTLLERVRRANSSEGSEAVIEAARDFFLESVSAFEVARRALQTARETAFVERQHATILRRLSSFLADASLALDASESLHEMLQLIADHVRELTGAERCVVHLTLDDMTAPIDAQAAEDDDPALARQANELMALYRALEPPSGALRMTGADLAGHHSDRTLTEAPGETWAPRGWLAAALTSLDGGPLGLIQAFDKERGDFSELDEAILMQLAQMASAAVDRTRLYRRVGGPANSTTAEQANSERSRR